MTPRVAYWCSSFDADMEALAGEVACLRRAFPGSITWGIAAREWLLLSPRRGFGFHPQLHLAFRAFASIAQRRFDVQHLFGGLGDWFHLRAVNKKPVVLTVAVDSPACEAGLLDKVDRFVVEWPGAAKKLEKSGIARDRIRTILPAVDLSHFVPSPSPSETFTVLFASSPDRADWLEARGVDLLLDAAALCPDYRFVLLWRPWGNSLMRVQEWIDQRRLTNVEVKVGRVLDIAREYQQAHVTVAPFVDMARCKPLPNSVIESLACGRPVLVSRGLPIASMIEDARAGLLIGSTGGELAECIRGISAKWNEYSPRARALAENLFCASRFVESYRQLYRELVPA